VHPGNIETPLFKKLTRNIGGGLKFTHETLVAMYPLDRISQPKEIAYSILFFASGESSFCMAIELVIDGGMIGAPLPFTRM
jgi:NAD(P)-dependent dehydrogenase (short-subunit alcohol dehydrogenase family)